MDVLEDLDRVKWNFVTFALGLISFINLNFKANDFIEKYGNDVHIKNLIVEVYNTGKLKIIGLMLLTIAIFALTIFIAYTIGSSLFGLLQIVASFFLIIWALVLAWAPFIGTLIIMMIIGGIIILAAND
jgi:hypothetical protein